MKAGDYDETELSEVMQDESVMADLVQSYKDRALDTKMIVFAVNRAHCAKIVERFNSSGFVAKSIDTDTPKDERENIVNDFRNNEFKILCNVNIFTEGFDCPDVDTIQLARPTKSLTLFLQQIGRCMRPHENKEYGIVLDNAGLWKQHGLPKMNRNWTLEGKGNICPTQKDILSIKENSTKGNKEPQESKGIRLYEIDELDNVNFTDVIDYDNIEKNLIDKKIITMRERIEELTTEIKELEESISVENKEFKRKIFAKELASRKMELIDLIGQFQPKRFEQVFDLILEKCQEVIDNNEVFFDTDKEDFLRCYFEPVLKLNLIKSTKETTREPQKISILVASHAPLQGQIEVFHNFPKSKTKATAVFDPSSKKIIYNGENNLSPSRAAEKATEYNNGKKIQLNGWIFWFYIDDNGNKKTIKGFQ